MRRQQPRPPPLSSFAFIKSCQLEWLTKAVALTILAFTLSLWSHSAVLPGDTTLSLGFPFGPSSTTSKVLVPDRTTYTNKSLSRAAYRKNHQPTGAVRGGTIGGSNITTIAIAVTVTACSDFPLDSAAVLQYSILRVPSSRYQYQFYAIYHPNASTCVHTLSSLGFVLLERETPVNVSEIKGSFLRERITTNGCCGEKELIKFEAFRLTQHPIVVLMDMDVLVLQPMEDILNFILHHETPNDHHLMWPGQDIPSDIQLLYTLDYAMVNPMRPFKPMQGGFVVLKPNATIYDDILSIVRRGNYGARGWDGKTGKFWGSMTFQGLLPYYFLKLHPGHAVELNWCRHNNMASPPRELVVRRNFSAEMCYTLQDDCEDCRTKHAFELYSAHYTNCQKPWRCQFHNRIDERQRLCRELHKEWFRVRSDMERSWGRSGFGTGPDSFATSFYGYCNTYGDKGYEQIRQPYGVP